MQEQSSQKRSEQEQPSTLRSFLNTPIALADYITNDPKQAYTELRDLYSRFYIISLRVGNLALAHEQLESFIRVIFPEDNAETDINNMNIWRDGAKLTAKLLGFD